jgi:hypothetical protein
LNQTFDSLGIPFRFLFLARCSSTTARAIAPPAKSTTAIVFAGTFGTIIEWYDFLIYGTAAALVFDKLFFPAVDPLTGTLASLATYAVGFVARPVGGALFGYFGDRIGRKSIWSRSASRWGSSPRPARSCAPGSPKRRCSRT